MGQVHIILGVVDTGTLFGEVEFVTIFIKSNFHKRSNLQR